MTIEFLDPTGLAPEPDAGTVAPRLTTLTDARIGLLDNSKPNAAVLLSLLGDRFERVYSAKARLYQKGEGIGAAGPMPEVLALSVIACETAVLNASGD
ncbi:MAG: hypothetical protein GEV07_19545 [Streptosporangiales bacterium]|nr:hypothetical protein [Streptosporangiales bacterium]